MDGFSIRQPTDNFSMDNVTVGNNLSVMGNFTMGNSSMPSMTWGFWLVQIGTPIFLLTGIPGNILTLLVLKSRRFRHKSYSHYLCTLAVFDSLVLVGRFMTRINDILRVTGHQTIEESYGDAACKIHNFSEHVCYLMSSWLVLCMTMERFIAVNFPFKKDVFCKPRNAVTVILVVFAVMSYSQIFRLIIYERLDHGGCGAPDRYTHIFVALHIYLYQMVLQFMLPALLILICNLSILFKIRRLRTTGNRGGGTLHHPASQLDSRRQNKTTCMLLTVSFTYVATLFPLVFLSNLLFIAAKTNPSTAINLMVNLHDVGKLFEFFSEMNYAVNFYIYVLSGAQFRYVLRHMCAKKYSFISSPAPTEKVFQFRKTASNS